jgi:RNA polymerase sigma-70 factor (ECF subfamily)
MRGTGVWSTPGPPLGFGPHARVNPDAVKLERDHADASVMRDALSSSPMPFPKVAANIPSGSHDVVDERLADVRSIDAVPGLVSAAKEGDKDAFGRLYRLHHSAITRMVRFHLGADHEDAASEVFVRAWSALPRYRDTGAPFVSWLYGIARHVVADEIRRRIRTVPSDRVPDTASPFREDDRLMIAEALAKLPPAQRQVIELKFLLGMKNPEVAAALGISTGAVNVKQWRGLSALRTLLEEP